MAWSLSMRLPMILMALVFFPDTRAFLPHVAPLSSPISPTRLSTLQLRTSFIALTRLSSNVHGVWLRAKQDDSDDAREEKPLSELTLEEIESLPDMSEYYQTPPQNRTPTVSDVMEQDRRFGFKMRALQGDFTPAAEAESKEDIEGGSFLAQTLIPFPSPLPFGVVVRNEEGAKTEILKLLNSVPGIEVEGHKVSERLGGKFLSLTVTCMVESA
eukprot:CAMPEP_0196750586 /NCGR_PEP_ID=MMETSP1091-20130531/80955_1 /TAXON_ID=302021 /ORGANISM="Rhodomonas sp., Strain CCMP768" /LENGTH=213 /DNA_ID=CAMNT_0042098219 /DNA_START=56 /DNA_END=693 /DNA_ORIENTATION=+